MTTQGKGRKQGGNRPGAGRPRTLPDAKRRRHTVSLRLNDAELAKAKRIGSGRAADGLRVALEDAAKKA